MQFLSVPAYQVTPAGASAFQQRDHAQELFVCKLVLIAEIAKLFLENRVEFNSKTEFSVTRGGSGASLSKRVLLESIISEQGSDPTPTPPPRDPGFEETFSPAIKETLDAVRGKLLAHADTQLAALQDTLATVVRDPKAEATAAPHQIDVKAVRILGSNIRLIADACEALRDEDKTLHAEEVLELASKGKHLEIERRLGEQEDDALRWSKRDISAQAHLLRIALHSYVSALGALADEYKAEAPGADLLRELQATLSTSLVKLGADIKATCVGLTHSASAPGALEAESTESRRLAAVGAIFLDQLERTFLLPKTANQERNELAALVSPLLKSGRFFVAADVLLRQTPTEAPAHAQLPAMKLTGFASLEDPREVLLTPTSIFLLEDTDAGRTLVPFSLDGPARKVTNAFASNLVPVLVDDGSRYAIVGPRFTTLHSVVDGSLLARIPASDRSKIVFDYRGDRVIQFGPDEIASYDPHTKEALWFARFRAPQAAITGTLNEENCGPLLEAGVADVKFLPSTSGRIKALCVAQDGTLHVISEVTAFSEKAKAAKTELVCEACKGKVPGVNADSVVQVTACDLSPTEEGALVHISVAQPKAGRPKHYLLRLTPDQINTPSIADPVQIQTGHLSPARDLGLTKIDTTLLVVRHTPEGPREIARCELDPEEEIIRGQWISGKLVVVSTHLLRPDVTLLRRFELPQAEPPSE